MKPGYEEINFPPEITLNGLLSYEIYDYFCKRL